MKIIKIANKPIEREAEYIGGGFREKDVRRLMSIFGNFKDWSGNAEAEMEKWLENKEYDISFEEAKERLNYYINQLGLRD
jgi:hypothetical protein